MMTCSQEERKFAYQYVWRQHVDYSYCPTVLVVENELLTISFIMSPLEYLNS